MLACESAATTNHTTRSVTFSCAHVGVLLLHALRFDALTVF